MNTNCLEVVVAGNHFINPVLLASGTAGDGKQISQFVDLEQLGGLITKTITFKPRCGNPPPRLLEVSGGLLNSIGLENKGVAGFLKESAPFLKELKTKIIVSVGGGTIEEFSQIVGYLEKKGAGFVTGWELNLSCPNVKKGGLLFSLEVASVGRVVRGVKKISSRPIFLKLSVASDYLKIVEIALKNGAAGFSLINTLPALAIDLETGRPCLGGGTGGLSGPALKPVALEAVYQVWKEFRVPIIGGGGIFSTNDALEFIMAGASLVAVGTASFIQPTISLEIVAGLKKFLQ